MGVEWRTRSRCSLGVPTEQFGILHRSNVRGPNFEIASTDPYFGAGEKGVELPMKIKNVELANT